MKFRNFNFLNHFIPPRIHTDYDYRLRHNPNNPVVILRFAILTHPAIVPIDGAVLFEL